MRAARHSEGHLSHRSNWLRAAVLGANDGIVSTASLVLGVAASGASSGAIVTAGIAGLVAGALSMAAGEFVSVSSQRDSERADLRLEERELRDDPPGELRELAWIYEKRGVPSELAWQVAVALTERDALGAHARDELGLEQQRRAPPAGGSPAQRSPYTPVPLSRRRRGPVKPSRVGPFGVPQAVMPHRRASRSGAGCRRHHVAPRLRRR